MEISYNLKMKNIKKFAKLFKTDVDILNENELNTTSREIIENIFIEITNQNNNEMLMTSFSLDPDDEGTTYNFYKNGKYIVSLNAKYKYLLVPKSMKHQFPGELIDERGNYLYDMDAINLLLKYKDDKDLDEAFYFEDSFVRKIPYKRREYSFQIYDNDKITDISKDEFLAKFDKNDMWLIDEFDINNVKYKDDELYLTDYAGIDYETLKNEYDDMRNNSFSEKEI